jgi:ABC-type transport system substrate-binding protein
MLEILQADLNSIGVKMTITQMDIASMLGRMNAHQFQAYAAGDNWSNFEPVTPLSADASLNYRVNNADFHDETYSRLVSTAAMDRRGKAQATLPCDVLLDPGLALSSARTISVLTTNRSRGWAAAQRFLPATDARHHIAATQGCE